MRSLSISLTLRLETWATQAGAISDRQRRLVLDAGRRVQQAGDLVGAQHRRQLARMRHPDQPPREVGPVERVREEQPQRRDDAVHRRHGNASLALIDLEAAQILRRGRVGRAPQKRGEAPHVADVVALRLTREAAHVHLVDQSLAQRTGSGWRERSRSLCGSSGKRSRDAMPDLMPRAT